MNTSFRLSSCLVVAASLSVATQTFSQSNDRQQFIEGLLRNFIESRIDNSRNTPPPIPNTPQPPALAPTPNNVATYRSEIQGFAVEVDKLTNQLMQESAKTPVLRSYLPDLYSVRSHAHLLAQNAGRLRNLEAERDQFASLDVSWRELSHRLHLDPSLSPQCSAVLDGLDARSESLCGLFGILPDFDRIEATILASQASAYIDALRDVIEFELYSQPNCDVLVQEGRQQMELARQLALNMTPFSMEEAIASTEEWGNSWLVYSAKLHSYRNPRLARAVSRVRSCQKGLYDLMRIEHPIDHSYLLYLSDQCRIASNKLFGSLSVRSLSRAGLSRDAINVLLNAEAAFRNQLGQFENSMSGTPQPQVVTARFLDLEREWSRCSVHFDSFTGEIAQLRASIDSQISDMRDHLAVTSAFNREVLLSHAATLEGLSSTLYTNVANVGRFVPSSRTRHQLFVESQTFLQHARVFHSQASAHPDPAVLSQTCRSLVDSWRVYSGTLQSLPAAGLRPDLYESLERIRCQIDPAVAEIAILVGM